MGLLICTNLVYTQSSFIPLILSLPSSPTLEGIYNMPLGQSPVISDRLGWYYI